MADGEGRPGRPGAVVVAGLALAGLATSAAALPEPRREAALRLEIRPLTAPLVDPATTPVLVVDPESGGRTEIALFWPGANDRCALRLEAHARIDPERETQRVSVRAELLLADGTRVRSERALEVGEASATLFEVYREGDRSLTLALGGRPIERTVLTTRAAPGRPVRFEIEVLRALGGRAVPLETNRLESFADEAVAYAFRIDDGHFVDLRLTVAEIAGNVAKLRVAVHGMLPAGPGPQLIARHDEWITTRGAPTTVRVEAGTPPAGYHFVVRPWF